MAAFPDIQSLAGERIFTLVETPSIGTGLPSQTDKDQPQRDAGAFTLHWSQAQLSVRAYLTSFLSNRSSIDDCIQDIAILAWKKGPSGPMSEPFLAFCLACAKRIAMAEVRKKYRARTVSLSPEVLSSLADSVALMEKQEAREPGERITALRLCLASMESGPRRLLELRYSSKDPAALQNEANATGKSMDAIYKKLERLRSLLRECVTKRSNITE